VPVNPDKWSSTLIPCTNDAGFKTGGREKHFSYYVFISCALSKGHTKAEFISTR